MLKLTRKLGESIRISNDITITVVGIYGNRVCLSIKAPTSIVVKRNEITVRPIGAGPTAGAASGSN